MPYKSTALTAELQTEMGEQGKVYFSLRTNEI